MTSTPCVNIMNSTRPYSHLTVRIIGEVLVFLYIGEKGGGKVRGGENYGLQRGRVMWRSVPVRFSLSLTVYNVPWTMCPRMNCPFPEGSKCNPGLWILALCVQEKFSLTAHWHLQFILLYILGRGGNGVSDIVSSLAQWCTATTPVGRLWQIPVRDCFTLFYTPWCEVRVRRTKRDENAQK